MSARSVSVSLGVARRSTRKLAQNPVVNGAPPLLIPLFMFAAFAGAMSSVAKTKGFDYYNFTAFVFVYVLYLATLLAGVFSGFEIAADFSSGLGNRFMLAAPKRMAIVGGYVLSSIGRAFIAIAVIWAVALITGMSVRGNALQIAGVVALALMLNVAALLYGAGVALRLRSLAGATLIFIPVFMLTFLTPTMVPRSLLSGWVHTVAGINPLTPALEAGRGFLAAKPEKVGLAFGAAAGLMVVFLLWAIRGMRKAEAGPGAPARRGPRARRG